MTSSVVFQFCTSNRALALSQHKAYVEGVTEKLFPPFDNIKDEADKHADDIFRRFGEIHGWENGPDMADFADDAFEHGLEKYENLMFVKGQLSALATAGLFHLWEKTLKAFILRELGHYGLTEEGKREIENANHRTLTEWLCELGFELDGKKYMEELEICRLIANTIKHGDGPSCRQLAERAPNLLTSAYGIDLLLDQPSADNLWIEAESFERFAEAIETFWNEMPETLVVPPSWYQKAEKSA